MFLLESNITSLNLVDILKNHFRNIINKFTELTAKELNAVGDAVHLLESHGITIDYDIDSDTFFINVPFMNELADKVGEEYLGTSFDFFNIYFTECKGNRYLAIFMGFEILEMIYEQKKIFSQFLK